MKILLFLLILGIQSQSSDESTQNRVLLVFLDGFRWDYVSCANIKSNLKGFSLLRNVGASIERMKPVFPADCYPNFYSVFSGHYPSKHGFLFNDLYNSFNGDAFSHTDNTTMAQLEKWLKVDLIWDQLKRVNMKSKLFNLPICQGTKKNETFITCIPYNKNKMTIENFARDMKDAMGGLLKGDYSFSVVYNDILDKTGHSEGPLSSKILDDIIPAIDKVIYSLIHDLEKRQDNNVHLVIASDHGLAESTLNRPINIEKYLLNKKIQQFLNRGTTLSIWSDPESAIEIKRHLELKNLPISYFNASTLPQNWKVDSFQHLFPTLYIIADPGFVFQTRYLMSRLPGMMNDVNERKGWHGYSPEHNEMHTPFFVYGPRVQRGVRLHYSDPLEITHIYHLLMNLLHKDYNELDHYNDHLPNRVLIKSDDTAMPSLSSSVTYQNVQPSEPFMSLSSIQEEFYNLVHIKEIPLKFQLSRSLFMSLIFLTFLLGCLFTCIVITLVNRLNSYTTIRIKKITSDTMKEPLINQCDE